MADAETGERETKTALAMRNANPCGSLRAETDTL